MISAKPEFAGNFLIMSIQRFASTPLLATIVAAVAGFLYLLTAARDIVVGDSPELITAAVTLGVAHPPGYPLFAMLGHLFSLFPVGPIPFRVNLLSVVCNALTAGVVFLTALRLSGSRIAAVLAALVLAFNPTFWRWSLAAEVLPLNNLLASLVIYFLMIWQGRPEQRWPLLLAAFTTGLAFSNHHTIILLGPAILFLVWRCRAALWARPQTIALALVVFLVGLLPYGYIPWAAARNPILNWGNVASLRDLFDMITRRAYGSYHLVEPAYQGGPVWPRIATLCFSFGALMGSFAILGMIRAYQHVRWYFWFSLLAFGSTGLLFAIISNFNLASMRAGAWVLERFFLLPEVAAAPLVALGVVAIVNVIASSDPAFRGKSLPVVAGALGLVLVVGLTTNYQQMDESRNRVARFFGEDLLASLEPDAILFVVGDPFFFPPLYLTAVEKVRPDVTLVAIPLLYARWYIAQLRMRDPPLNIPFDFYDGQGNNFKKLIEANPGRPIALLGPPPDSSAMRDYWPYPHGLVQLIQPKSKWIEIDDYVRDNEQLFKSYRPPAPASIRVNTFESAILFSYSLAAWQIGSKYENAGSKTKARAWYQRARAIDPNSEQIYRGLREDATRFQALYNGGF